MRIAAVVLGLLLVSAAGAGAGGAPAAGTLSCSGRQCTLTVKNTSGQAMSSLALVWQSSVKLVAATDPAAKPQNVAGPGNTITPLPAGRCAVFTGTNAICSYSTTPAEPGWADGQTHKVTLTAAAKVPSGTNVAACPQAPSGATTCADIGFGSSSTKTTAPGAGGHDVGIEIVKGPTSIHLGPKRAKETPRYVFKITNEGSLSANVSFAASAGGTALPFDWYPISTSGIPECGASKKPPHGNLICDFTVDAGETRRLEVTWKIDRIYRPELYDRHYEHAVTKGRLEVHARSGKDVPNRLPNEDALAITVYGKG